MLVDSAVNRIVGVLWKKKKGNSVNLVKDWLEKWIQSNLKHLKEHHGGSELNGTVVNDILVGQVFKTLDGLLLVARVHHHTNVAIVTC